MNRTMPILSGLKIFYNGFLITVKRFPLPSLFIFLFYILSTFLSVNSRHSLLPKQLLDKGSVCLYLCACGYLLFRLSENFTIRFTYKLLLSVALYFTIAWYLYTETTPFITFIFSFGGLLALRLATSLNASAKNALDVWGSWYLSLHHLAFLILSTSLFFIGAVFVIKSVTFLFAVQFYTAIYIDVTLFTFLFLLPMLSMTDISAIASRSVRCYPKNLTRLFAYFVMPLLLTSAAIINCYIIKIFLLWEFPKGVITYLTGIYGCASIGAYLAVYPLKNDKGIIGWFNKHVFKLMLLPLVAYAFSLGLRIQSYGITEWRYVAMLCWTWLTLVTSSSFFKNQSCHLRFLLGTAALISFMAVLGPLRMTVVAAHSQGNRLALILTRHGFLVDGKIHRSDRSIPIKEHREIISIVSYLVKTNKTNYIKPWFLHLDTPHLQSKMKYYNTKLILQDMGITPKLSDQVHVTGN